MPHFESSLYAEKKSYQNHGDALHTSRVTALQTCCEREEAFDISNFSPISCNFVVAFCRKGVLSTQKLRLAARLQSVVFIG